MMIHVFYKNRNTIGQFMVALIFLGTFGFLFTYDGFVSKSKATSCCCSGEAAVTSFASDSSGDFGSEIPMDAETVDGYDSGKDNIPISSSNSNSDDCDCLESDDPNDTSYGSCECPDGNYDCQLQTCRSDNLKCDVDEGTCANKCQGVWCSISEYSGPCEGDCD
jgi:hypothetical protein